MQDSPNVSSDPDNLWAPRTVAFFAIVILANLVVDLAAITGYAFARVEATGGLSTRYVSGFLEGILIGLFATQIVALAIWTANFPGSSTALAGGNARYVRRVDRRQCSNGRRECIRLIPASRGSRLQPVEPVG